jgi:hypothetical protein
MAGITPNQPHASAMAMPTTRSTTAEQGPWAEQAASEARPANEGTRDAASAASIAPEYELNANVSEACPTARRSATTDSLPNRRHHCRMPTAPPTTEPRYNEAAQPALAPFGPQQHGLLLTRTSGRPDATGGVGREAHASCSGASGRGRARLHENASMNGSFMSVASRSSAAPQLCCRDRSLQRRCRARE